jgi:hypothetical protein
MSEQRVNFVVRAASGKERITVLCQEFGVSRNSKQLYFRKLSIMARFIGENATFAPNRNRELTGEYQGIEIPVP